MQSRRAICVILLAVVALCVNVPDVRAGSIVTTGGQIERQLRTTGIGRPWVEVQLHKNAKVNGYLCGTSSDALIVSRPGIKGYELINFVDVSEFRIVDMSTGRTIAVLGIVAAAVVVIYWLAR